VQRDGMRAIAVRRPRRQVSRLCGDGGYLLRTTEAVSAFVVLMSWLAIEIIPRLWWAYKMWGN
jgi:hypothetical protein